MAIHPDVSFSTREIKLISLIINDKNLVVAVIKAHTNTFALIKLYNINDVLLKAWLIVLNFDAVQSTFLVNNLYCFPLAMQSIGCNHGVFEIKFVQYFLKGWDLRILVV